jgi:hypothetical protein
MSLASFPDLCGLSKPHCIKYVPMHLRKITTAFFEGPRLQIAMMWAVKRRSNSAFAAKEPNDQPSNSFAQNTRTLWE